MRYNWQLPTEPGNSFGRGSQPDGFHTRVRTEINMHWETLGTLLTNLMWGWLALLLLQPVVRQSMLSAARQNWLRKLEKTRESRVIALIHRNETVNIMGMPVLQYMDIEDSEAVLRAIRLTAEDVPLDIVLHTPGGVSLAAEQIARALCRHKAKVTVFVPHYAMAGGALIALSANELVMCADAVLGALDPRVGGYPAASVIAVAERKGTDELDDDTLILLDQARKATSQTKAALKSMLKLKVDEEKAETIAQYFTSGRWTQDYPVSVNELQEIGVQVTTTLPVEVSQFMGLFPQSNQHRPSVDFIATPYKSTIPIPAPTPGPEPR